MFSQILTAALVATLATPASAFIRFGCQVNLVEQRADPIVNPGAVAGHAHKIAGGSGFDFEMDYAKARSSKCSSCPIKADLSNYWTPKLYFRYPNGTFQSVPTAGDNAADQNGGMTVYYLQRGPAADTKTLKAFPEGFRMLAGDNYKRAPGTDFASQGVNYACLGANKPETNGLPNYNCPGGLRAQIFFPSCWDGKSLDSADHKSHMSYPASGNYNGGACPSTHPVQTISLFYEILYDTNKFKDQWYGNQQPFVFANGDATGYGFHGDFVNGWDVPTLQRVINECTNPNDQGVIEKCAPIANQLYTGAEQSACRIPPKINEKVAGFLPALPGCNPVSYGPAPQAKDAACNGQVVPTIGAGATYFTDMTTKGWAYQGCASDGSPRTLPDKTTMYQAGVGDKMTVEYCADFCKGYAYFGLEYAGECWCGNSIPNGRAPKAGIFGACNMKCKGNGDQFCGGPGALSLYKTCSGANCQNVNFDGTTGGTSPVVAPVNPAPPASSVVAAPVGGYSPVAPVVKPVSQAPSVVAPAPSGGAQKVTVYVTKTVATVTVTKSACGK